MTFAEIFNNTGRPALLGQHGEGSRFRYRLDGCKTWEEPTQALIGAESVKEERAGDDDQRRERVVGLEVTVSIEAAPAGIPDGKISGVAQVNDVDFAVIEKVTSGSFVTFVLERRELIELSRKKLREQVR